MEFKATFLKIHDIDTLSQQFEAEVFVQARWEEKDFLGMDPEVGTCCLLASILRQTNACRVLVEALVWAWISGKGLLVYKPTGQLRSSSDTSILCLPSVCTHSLGQRLCSCAAPSVWNTLPYEIRSSSTLSSFKLSLKTYLL